MLPSLCKSAKNDYSPFTVSTLYAGPTRCTWWPVSLLNISHIANFLLRLHRNNVTTCSAVKRRFKDFIKPHWNFELRNIYITKSSVWRTILFAPVIVKYMEKKPRITKPRNSEHILLVLWFFVTSRYRCSSLFSNHGFHFAQRVQ